MSDYLLDNEWAEQRRRLAALEAWFDPGTIRHLEALGVGPGWRCLDVGAGGGSIAAWLAERVGPEGHVLATDLDTRFLEPLRSPTLAVARHNILTDTLPEGAFDLVHARFVVEHLRERDTALANMLRALKPGGWLVLEETDASSWVAAPASAPDAVALFTKWTEAFAALFATNGTPLDAGRRTYSDLRALGLRDVGAEGRVFMVQGGSWPAGEVWQLTARQVGDRIVEAGLLTADEMARVVALLGDPAFTWMEGLVMAAWGRKLSAGS